jgi:hypothetical protein
VKRQPVELIFHIEGSPNSGLRSPPFSIMTVSSQAKLLIKLQNSNHHSSSLKKSIIMTAEELLGALGF